jgi:hypothetical protein
MMISTNGYFRAILYILRGKPVLTAMMVSSLVLGLTGLAAAITVWRDNSSCAIPHKTVHPYLVQIVEGMIGRVESG